MTHGLLVQYQQSLKEQDIEDLLKSVSCTVAQAINHITKI